MSDVDRRFHETWLGMVQPVEGLVVSVPVLVDAQCMERQPPSVQEKLVELCPPTRQGETGPEGHRIADLPQFFHGLLGFAPDAFDAGEALPEELSLWVPEGKQTIAPTFALRKLEDAPAPEGADATPASKAGARYEMLVWDLGAFPGGAGLDLDKPETVTGPWDYPPAAKFDRLLRHCRVPIGLVTNREVVRLVYAPHGESSGAITFRIDDMASVSGRPILDAFVMLLSANRFFGVTEERTLPAILAESRKRQANVTNELADQVFDALQILLAGFEAAAERDGRALLDDALEREDNHLYKGLLTVLLRLVFVLYAEDRGLLPIENETYAKNLSVLGLFEELQADHGAYPDSMSRRFGAWGRLVTLFRAIFLGLSHGDLVMPPRRGSLFDPHTYPFLEGWGPAGSAPITQPEDRAAVKLPSIDDETVYRVLEKLLVFEGQRLSYRALDVEQIGSVYEALMGYEVVRMPAPAVCMRPNRVWVTVEEVLEVRAELRAKWLKDTIGLKAAEAKDLSAELQTANSDAALELLARHGGDKKRQKVAARAKAGQLVLQPGSERRRTSSHYTPRSLSAPIVRRTLEPLLAVMGEAPPSERILSLKVCDPAMGSGAFLVEACRFLADQVVAAWTREGKIEAIAAEHGDPLLHARRLVAQRCLYGVDKNEMAVELAKLSLWLVTLSKTLPFTFLDHALRHGDSLVGLDFDQLRAFHWKPPAKDEEPKSKKKRSKDVPEGQLSLFGREIEQALEEAIALRQKIGELGDAPMDDREKERLLWDAQDALDRVRLIGDVLVGAFFAHDKDKDREKERARREEMVRAWLLSGGPPTEEVRAMQREIRARIPVFHWMVEFPEVFYAERPDPLEHEQINRAAYMDAFVGNPPFAGKNGITEANGPGYVEWLMTLHPDVVGKPNTDLSAYFFRRTAMLLGMHGTLGLIATNTIAEGDSRLMSLKYLVDRGADIYAARSSMRWPGAANVSVSIVHLAFGNARTGVRTRELDGNGVELIDSRLTPSRERRDPARLSINAGLSFMGGKLVGVGLAMSLEERAALVAADPRNAEVLRPYLGGEEVNHNPCGRFDRYMIDFTTKSLEEARAWPMLMRIIEEKVRPARENDKRGTYKTYWWRPGESGAALYAALVGMERCLVAANVTKHLTFSFQSTRIFFAQTLYVFPLDAHSSFAVLQSRIHEPWARLLSSSLEDRLRYSASDCFETFPFPKPDPRTVIDALEDVGQRLYDARAKYMVDENVGLTITYNRLKDPACTDPRILELRALHEEMDRAVLAAYAENDPDGNWTTLEVPPYCPITDDDKAKLAAFEDAVIDRLFALNAKRAEEEKRLGLGAPASKQKKARAKAADTEATGTSAPEKKRSSRKKPAAEQLGIQLAPEPPTGQ